MKIFKRKPKEIKIKFKHWYQYLNLKEWRCKRLMEAIINKPKTKDKLKKKMYQEMRKELLFGKPKEIKKPCEFKDIFTGEPLSKWCPLCEAEEKGISSSWGGSPEFIEEIYRKHKEHIPTESFKRKD